MSYDATGVTDDGRGYGVFLRAVAESDSEPGSEVAGKFRYLKLMMEDQSQGPWLVSRDLSWKMRTDCKINAGVSRDDLEAFLSSDTDGLEISKEARDDILRLVHDSPENSSKYSEVGFYVWVDVFYSGIGTELRYWFDDNLEHVEGESDEEDEEKDGPVSARVIASFRVEEIEEERGCGMCGKEKAEAGSRFMWLACEHSFHMACVYHWFNQHRYCPTCNYRPPLQSYKDYPCVCGFCLYFREEDPDHQPDHPPPYIKFA